MMRSLKRTGESRLARSRSRLGGLLALNGALLLGLGAVTLGPTADAQSRARGDYTMVGGGVKGSNADVVYVVDTVNQELIALTYDTSTKRLKGIGFRNLAADAASVRSGGRQR